MGVSVGRLDGVFFFRGRRLRARFCARFAGLLFLALALIVVALGPGAAPAAAQSKTCPELAPVYTGPCGPRFVQPGWGDAGGWKNPDQYGTIQLADVDGDGKKELLARTPGGLAIYWFNPALGQWQPQGDASAGNVPVILKAFANPPPLTTTNPNPQATDWTLPQYYETIQAADIDGDKRDEIIARSAAGLIVFKFTPGKSSGQGTWRQVTTEGPFKDAGGWATEPSYYGTIQAGDIDGDGEAEVIGRDADGLHTYSWTGSSWKELAPLPGLGDKAGFSGPAYWSSIQLGNVVGDDREELLARNSGGVLLYEYGSGKWTQISATHPFSDLTGQADCPFTRGGPCLGSGPTYYKTMQLADVDGSGYDALVARGNDGLHMYSYQTDRFTRVPATLTDLSDANGFNALKYSDTLQFADINGDGTAEALARDKDGVQAWTFDGVKWIKLAPKTTLNLADDPWAGDPADGAAAQRSYYSTIMTGDVNGDGRDDVVARGPYGIRTWFYNRPGSGDGGWGGYLASGYQDDGLTTAQKAALVQLDGLAAARGLISGPEKTVRDVWTRADAPNVSRLDGLRDGLVSLGGCTTKTSDVPPQYQTCTAAPAGVTVPDWTVVLNEILAEDFWAKLVVQYFGDLQTVQGELFLEETSQLTKMGNDLAVQAAKNNRTDLSPQEFASGVAGIVGSLVGLIPGGEPFAAALEVTSELVSMVASGTEKLADDTFKGTFDQFQARFADGISDAAVTTSAYSEIVRNDRGLLTAVGQLYYRIGQKLDKVGMESAGRQGFAVQVYKDLLPTVYVRWKISGCGAHCYGLPAGTPGALGTSTAFTAIGSPPLPGSLSPLALPFPCNQPGFVWECHYDQVNLSADLSKTLWGPVQPKCVYQGSAQQQWTFGCSLGLDPTKTINESPIEYKNWNFLTYTGTPVVLVCAPNSGCTPIGNVTPPPGARRLAQTERRALTVGQTTTVRLTGSLGLPRSVSLARARISLPRLLYEPAGAGELARVAPHSRASGLTLVPTARRGGTSHLYTSRRGPRPHPVLSLRQRAPGLLSFDLRVPRARVALPAACSGTRPGEDLETGAITLRTRLQIDDGPRRPVAISFDTRWRCRRDRLGAVRSLTPQLTDVRYPRQRALAVAVRGPRRPHAGQRVAYRITVRNPRRTDAYGVLVRAYFPLAYRLLGAPRGRRGTGQVIWRLERLRRGRSRTLVLRFRAPGRANGRPNKLAVVTNALNARTSSRVVRTSVRP